jgi:hypothetical protein
MPTPSSVPNVNQITSQFARMSDPQLQQYAALHKDDPYTMSLALAESNRRKDMRSGQMQGAGQQPKVVDQAIAGMAPQAQMFAPQQAPQGMTEMAQQAQRQAPTDNSGIAQLPADNIKGMAEGGIVGFAPGGQTGLAEYEGAGGNVFPNPTPYEGMGIGQFLQAAGSDGLEFLKRSGNSIADLFPTRADEDAKIRNAFAASTNAQQMEAYRSRAGVGERTLMQPALPPDAALPVGDSTPPGAAQQALPGTAQAAAPRAAGQGIGALGVGPPAAGVGFMDRLKAARAAQGATVDPFAAQRQGVADENTENARTALSDLKAEQEAQGLGFKGQEDRLNKREAALAGEAKSNEAFSFINAGLAMMQSNGRGLAGLAAGATVGFKQYGEGIAKIKLAQEKADDARDKIEELRRSQSLMNSKELRTANSEIRSASVKGKALMLDGLTTAFGADRAEVTAAVTSDTQSRESALNRASQQSIAAASNATTLKAANIGAASSLERAKLPGDQERLFAKLGGGDVGKGYAIFTGDAKRAALFENFNKSSTDMVAGEAFRAAYPTFTSFLAAMQGPAGTGGAGPVPASVPVSANSRP